MTVCQTLVSYTQFYLFSSLINWRETERNKHCLKFGGLICFFYLYTHKIILSI